MNDALKDRVAEPAAPHWTFSILHAARLIEERLELALGKVGLSMAKHTALTQLARAGEPLTLSQLATRLSCVRSNITQLVDRLEVDGLVKRLPDPADRRSIKAELTELGMERQQAGDKALRRVQSELGATLTPTEGSSVQSVLSALK